MPHGEGTGNRDVKVYFAAGTEEGEVCVEIRLQEKVAGEDGAEDEWIEQAYSEEWFWIRRSYTELEPIGMNETLPPGESEDVWAGLKEYSRSDEGENNEAIPENVCLQWNSYNDEVITIEYIIRNDDGEEIGTEPYESGEWFENGAEFRITRTGLDGTDLKLEAQWTDEDGNPSDYAGDRWYNFRDAWTEVNVNWDNDRLYEDGSLNLNPNSLTVKKDCYLEPAFAGAKAYDSFQFVRQGFFCVDAKDSKEDALVFNRIVSLKSSFVLPKQGE